MNLSNISFKTGYFATFLCLLYVHISVSISCSFLYQHISFKAAPLQLTVSLGLQGSSVEEAGNGFHGSSASVKWIPPKKAAQDAQQHFSPDFYGYSPLHLLDALAAICCLYSVLVNLVPLQFLSQEQAERLLWHAHRHGPSSPKIAQQPLVPNQTEPAIISKQPFDSPIHFHPSQTQK